MKKSDLGWMILVLALGGILFFAVTVDRLPEAYSRYLKDMQMLRAQHEDIISQLQVEQNEEKRRLLARRYVLESQIWEAGIADFIKYMQNLGSEVFLTTRNKTMVAGKMHELKGFQNLIAETRKMLHNAMEGKISAEHRALGIWVPDEGREFVKSLNATTRTSSP